MSSELKETEYDRLSGWSHDMRTAAFVIQGYADQLANSSGDPKQLADGIRSNARYLLSLIDSLSGDRPCEDEDALESLDSIVAAVIDGLKVGASHRGLRLAAELGPELPSFAPGQAICLKRILMNLSSNAIKYSDRGTITIKAGVRGRSAGSRQEGDGFYLEVADQGPGMAQEQIEAVVATECDSAAEGILPAHPSRTGLRVTELLVRSLDGKLCIGSQLGDGTRVRVEFPLGPPRSRNGRAAHPSRLHTPEGSAIRNSLPTPHRDDRILLVDDDVDVQRLLRFSLESAGWAVTVLSRGRQALTENWQRYRAILLDVNLPDLDGFATAKELKRTGCALPILALSAQRPSRKDRLGDPDAGVFDDWIDKLEGGTKIVHRLRKYLA